MASAVEQEAGTNVAVVPVQHAPVQQQRTMGLLRPIADPADILAAQNELRALIASNLRDGVDYGTIPGTDKPTLLKPGAEKINRAFGVVAEFVEEEAEVDHAREIAWRKEKKVYRDGSWTGDYTVKEGVALGLYRYKYKCVLIHQSGTKVGEGVGVASSLEAKYIENPRDSENTIAKMAQKRAYICATLLAHGLSEQFTQDVEDMGSHATETKMEKHGDGARYDVSKVRCPVCGGEMYDNRATKRSSKAPDFKCKNAECGKGKGIYWSGEWQKLPGVDVEGEKRADPTTTPGGDAGASSAGHEKDGAHGAASAPTNETRSTAPNAATAPSGSGASSRSSSETPATADPITRDSVIDFGSADSPLRGMTLGEL
jgi:uncharacterized protein with PIN domain